MRGGPVRPVVPGDHPAGRVRPDQVGNPAAGVGDGDRLCPLARRPLLPSRVAEDLAGWWQLLQGRGVPGAGLGWGGRGRPAAPNRAGPDESAHLPWRAGRKILICNPADRRPRWRSGANGYWRPRFCPAAASPRRPLPALSLAMAVLVNQRHRRVWAAPSRSGSRPTGRCCRRSRRPRLDSSLRLPATTMSARRQRLLGPPAVVGRRVQVTADLNRVRVHCEGRLVADHGRCWARHQSISDPDHLRAAARLRAERAAVTGRDEAEVQLRRLADDDVAFGLDDGEVA